MGGEKRFSRSRYVVAVLVVPGLLLLPRASLAGISVTSIQDVSPNQASFTPRTQQSYAGRTLAVAVSADGTRLYSGGFSGVWRSDDGGDTWRQLTRPQPPSGGSAVAGALKVPNIADLAVSRNNPDVVLAATFGDARVDSSQNGIYRSADGGETWERVHRHECPGDPDPGRVAQTVFAPDDSSLVYAAEGCAVAVSRDEGQTWTVHSIPSKGLVWHLAVAEQEGSVRKVYGVGDDQIWVSRDGGETWSRDPGASGLSDFGHFPGQLQANASAVLALEPGRTDVVFLAVRSGANGPSYYHPAKFGPDGETKCNEGSPPKRPCGEGSLWMGDFSAAGPGGGADWEKLPGPPAYFWNSTDSGRVYLVAHPLLGTMGLRGYLIFFSDRAHVHVSAGRPTARSWHRLDGRDASVGRRAGCFGNDEDGSKGCNQLFLHVDPHALVASAGFNITLKAPAGVSFPYDQNRELDAYLRGRLWMANDGGVYRSDDGGQTWKLGAGLTTLQPQAPFAGIALPGKPPALYFGVPDNDNFFTLDGGARWRDPVTNCGDCGAWFADPADPRRVLEVNRDDKEGSSWSLYLSSMPGAYPDPGSSPVRIPLPDNSNRGQEPLGYRPIVLTPISEDPPEDGDYILIRAKTGGTRVLLRTTRLRSITSKSDWDTTATEDGPGVKAFQQGPVFLPEMAAADVVQASGPHRDPFFFVADPNASGSLWRWTRGAPTWQRIVPAADGSASHAWRFFVDPYNPSRIYILDDDCVKRSEDAGRSWACDADLDAEVTESGTFPRRPKDLGTVGQAAVIRDMVFVAKHRRLRFAVGESGVFATTDGERWTRLLSATALPGHPVAAYYDEVSDPAVPALYVALNGRSLLRLDLAITLPIEAPDCNANGVDDADDIFGGGSADVDASGVPDECEQGTVRLSFAGTAQGGSVTLTVQGPSAVCSLTVPTSAGQSAAAVAASLAVAVNADACFQGQGISAQANSGALFLTGLHLGADDVTLAVADPGLNGAVSIPALSVPGLALLALLLLTAGTFLLAGRRRQAGP